MPLLYSPLYQSIRLILFGALGLTVSAAVTANADVQTTEPFITASTSVSSNISDSDSDDSATSSVNQSANEGANESVYTDPDINANTNIIDPNTDTITPITDRTDANTGIKSIDDTAVQSLVNPNARDSLNNSNKKTITTPRAHAKVWQQIRRLIAVA